MAPSFFCLFGFGSFGSFGRVAIERSHRVVFGWRPLRFSSVTAIGSCDGNRCVSMDSWRLDASWDLALIVPLLASDADAALAFAASASC